MRILLISSFYPPHVVGGYEQNVQDMNRLLQARGHETYVLTSRYGLDAPEKDKGVARVLYLESDMQHYDPLSTLTHSRRLQWNLDQTVQRVQSFAPDIVFIQVTWNLSRGVSWIAEQLMPGRVVYYMPTTTAYPLDTRVNYWRSPAATLARQAIKRFLAPAFLRAVEVEHRRFQLEFKHILCVSEAARQGIAGEIGRDPVTITIVNNGVELGLFYPPDDWGEQPISSTPALLFAGTVTEHKGVHTAIDALSILRQSGSSVRPTLAIVGSGHVDYEARLREQIRDCGLEEYVTFVGRVQREAMPELMRQFDALLLPSIWDEPLARVMQEAMASGLLVIGTNTGGTGEVLVDGETGLVFPPGDAVALADCITKMTQEPEWAYQLAVSGRERILDHFSLDRMVDEMETYLEQVVRTADAESLDVPRITPRAESV